MKPQSRSQNPKKRYREDDDEEDDDEYVEGEEEIDDGEDAYELEDSEDEVVEVDSDGRNEDAILANHRNVGFQLSSRLGQN